MSFIKSILIQNIDTSIDSDYIIEALYCNNIATVSRITLIECETKSGNYNKAYVDIHEWHETEVAYNLINKIKDSNREARFVHADDDWWVIDLNNENITHNKQFSYQTKINFLACNCDEEAELRTNKPGIDILSYLKKVVFEKENQEWNEIKCALYEMDIQRNIECELCV